MKFTIAVFDFDGTITKKDTFLDFIFQSRGFCRFYWGGVKSLPILLFYILKIISADTAKEKIFSHFFKGMPEAGFDRLCKNYSLNRLPKIIKKAIFLKINWHKEQGHEPAIVSASMENWIRPWAQVQGFKKIISTIPEIKNGILTGNFKTKNCSKEEKVKRFLSEYPNRKDYYLYVYGNSYKDQWLFKIADKAFYLR